MPKNILGKGNKSEYRLLLRVGNICCPRRKWAINILLVWKIGGQLILSGWIADKISCLSVRDCVFSVGGGREASQKDEKRRKEAGSCWREQRGLSPLPHVYDSNFFPISQLVSGCCRLVFLFLSVEEGGKKNCSVSSSNATLLFHEAAMVVSALHTPFQRNVRYGNFICRNADALLL